jgi:hypothetical protein
VVNFSFGAGGLAGKYSLLVGFRSSFGEIFKDNGRKLAQVGQVEKDGIFLEMWPCGHFDMTIWLQE